MSVEHVILCGGSAAGSGGSNKGTVRLHLWGKHANVTLKISDISEKMATNIPPVLVDLLEIATYVYCADQATTRGAGNTRQYGAQWRRRFTFHIPVREPDVWSSHPVLTALQDTLGFLSDDAYAFTFTALTDPPAVAQYLDFGLPARPVVSGQRRSSCFREASTRSAESCGQRLSTRRPSRSSATDLHRRSPGDRRTSWRI